MGLENFMNGCRACVRVSIYLIITHSIILSSPIAVASKNGAHSRQKRLLWITDDGRLALPPGTVLVISPSLSLPFVRYPPEGFLSNMTISLPFTIDFNKLGLTDNQNPYGAVPPVLARSMGRAAGNLLGTYLKQLILGRRKRDVAPPVQLPTEVKDALHGGERALLYIVIEDFLSNFGMNGKACLLRAICETHAHPLNNFGLFGEFLKLLFTPSKSPFSELLDEYVQAEKSGGAGPGPGDCWPYVKECPKSLFQKPQTLYSSKPNDDEVEIEKELNEEPVNENSVDENIVLPENYVPM